MKNRRCCVQNLSCLLNKMEDTEPEEVTGGKRSAWMAHVKRTMKANKGKSLKQVLKMAGKTYKKSKKGGALTPASFESSGAPASGATQKAGSRRRRGGKKTRKGGRLY